MHHKILVSYFVAIFSLGHILLELLIPSSFFYICASFDDHFLKTL